MSAPILLSMGTTWVCKNVTGSCGTEYRTDRFLPNRFHDCARLNGMSAPLVPEGVKAKVVAVAREDYVGNEVVRTDTRGQAISSVVTIRDDGMDRLVFAPMAVLHLSTGDVERRWANRILARNDRIARALHPLLRRRIARDESIAALRKRNEHLQQVERAANPRSWSITPRAGEP